MVLNEREKGIAWIVGGVVGAFLLGYGADLLYFAPRADYEKQEKIATTQNDANVKAILQSADAYKTWNDLDIQNDAVSVDQPTRTRIFQLASNYNFQISEWTASRAVPIPKQPDFQEVTFAATAVTSTARLARFLAMLESQHDLAIRLDALTVQSRKPGQDDLHVAMTIKALVYNPKNKADTRLTPPPLEPGEHTAAVARGPTAAARSTAALVDLTPNGFNILNAPLGSLDPGFPSGNVATEEQLKLRRQYQLDGKKLPKPRFGEEPLELLPGESTTDALLRRKTEQLKNAETMAAAKQAAIDAAAPVLPPGMTMEEYLAKKRQEQDTADAATAPATSTAPGGVR